MFAASSLVVAVLATYASVAVLSLSAAAPLVPREPPRRSCRGHRDRLAAAEASRAASSSAPCRTEREPGALADVSFVDFGKPPQRRSTRRRSASRTRPSTPLPLHLCGLRAPGVTAQFLNDQRAGYEASRWAVRRRSRSRAIRSTPARSRASLEISVPNSGLAPKVVTISGAQAPLPPGPVTATPAAGGAVDLSWAPSASVSGVAGYIVQRAPTGSTAFQQVGDARDRHDRGRPDEGRRRLHLSGGRGGDRHRRASERSRAGGLRDVRRHCPGSAGHRQSRLQYINIGNVGLASRSP